MLRHWHPGAEHDTGQIGAFFTPFELGADFRVEIGNADRVIDLCAGIGHLAYWAYHGRPFLNRPVEIVCVEMNPAYVEIGRRILPDATWICADVFDVCNLDLDGFDVAIGNPPFGRIDRRGKSARTYRGPLFEFHVVALAADLAERGVFVLPQGSAPFSYSGTGCYRTKACPQYQTFLQQTGIELEMNCGIDTSLYQSNWLDVAPSVEIVCADFELAREGRGVWMVDLFGQFG